MRIKKSIFKLLSRLLYLVIAFCLCRCGGDYSNETDSIRKFNFAIQHVISCEGGYSKHKNDRGGETKYGISRKQYPYLDIKNLTLGNAMAIYYRDYWCPNYYYLIPDMILATKMLDLAVNMGSRRANILLQRALRATGHCVKETGVFDKETFYGIKCASPREILIALRCESASHYRSIVDTKPSQYVFFNGWMKRAYK